MVNNCLEEITYFFVSIRLLSLSLSLSPLPLYLKSKIEFESNITLFFSFFCYIFCPSLLILQHFVSIFLLFLIVGIILIDHQKLKLNIEERERNKQKLSSRLEVNNYHSRLSLFGLVNQTQTQ